MNRPISYYRAGLFIDLYCRNGRNTSLMIISAFHCLHRIFAYSAVKSYKCIKNFKEVKWSRKEVNFLDAHLHQLDAHVIRANNMEEEIVNFQILLLFRNAANA